MCQLVKMLDLKDSVSRGLEVSCEGIKVCEIRAYGDPEGAGASGCHRTWSTVQTSPPSQLTIFPWVGV